MKTALNKPQIIEGGLAVDDRGQLSFANNFDFKGVKRFYMVENFSTDTIRAFHGHLKEVKYVFVVSGSAIVAAVELDNIKKPSKKNSVHRYVLSARKPTILYVPAGYANGFKALEPDTKIIFFSTSTMEESKGDDFRFPADYWGANVWHVENR
ncbi:MAG: sugar epimerase [Candidatus Yanofskybacteria bacterium RIFCSPHIGHO2_02_FULL_50_12]|uniref:Sugar epimerase n=1 Tax=Candidatus Yanofskybacteria bacterium RIFCSPHIGHO2_02_FULL_50_12 TaxID=1802685 RepID=A0A1F8FSX5_9BACT|nr:MAG: sugar epimerase [Candidatus Yanofskybacteria bacterium RIFCSPHIGHO2_02_FULL_50_12]